MCVRLTELVMKSFDLLHCPLLAGGVINDKRSPFALFFQWHLRINPFLCIMFIKVIPFHQASQLSGWVTEKIDRRFDWRTWELKINGFGIDYPINVAIYPLHHKHGPTFQHMESDPVVADKRPLCPHLYTTMTYFTKNSTALPDSYSKGRSRITNLSPAKMKTTI